MALITANLVADWNSSIGVTTSGSLVTGWTDQHQTLNPDGLGPYTATPNTGKEPTLFVDWQGNPCIQFPGNPGGTNPAKFLVIPTALAGLATQNLTVYIVASVQGTGNPTGASIATTLFSVNGHGAGWCNVQSNTFGPFCVSTSNKLSTVPVPLNKGVLVSAGRGTTDSVAQWNLTRSIGAAVVSNTGLSGGDIGLYATGSSQPFTGQMYRLLIYSAQHTNTQIDAQVAELSSEHSFPLAYTNQIMCHGDSNTEGLGVGNTQSWPYLLYQNAPSSWKVYDGGKAGIVLGPASTTGTMSNRAAAYIDPLFDATLSRNVIAVMGGTNDIANGADGPTTSTRLIEYTTNRKMAHAWETWPITIVDRAPNRTVTSSYNALTRSGDASFSKVIDSGLGSSFENRLSNSSNTTYFQADALHMNALGQSVMANFASPYLGPTGYIITGPLTGTAGSASSAFTVTLSNSSLFTGLETVTLTQSNGTITATAAGGTITGNGTASVIVEPAQGVSSFTFTITAASAGSASPAISNPQGWNDPGAPSYSALTVMGSLFLNPHFGRF